MPSAVLTRLVRQRVRRTRQQRFASFELTLADKMLQSGNVHMEYWLPEPGRLLFANAHHPELTMLVGVRHPRSIQIRKQSFRHRFDSSYFSEPTPSNMDITLRSLVS